MRENQMNLGTTYNNDVKDNVTGNSLGLYGLPIWTILLFQIQQETLSQNIKWRRVEKAMGYLPLDSLWMSVCGKGWVGACTFTHTKDTTSFIYFFNRGDRVWFINGCFIKPCKFCYSFIFHKNRITMLFSYS